MTDTGNEVRKQEKLLSPHGSMKMEMTYWGSVQHKALAERPWDLSLLVCFCRLALVNLPDEFARIV